MLSQDEVRHIRTTGYTGFLMRISSPAQLRPIARGRGVFRPLPTLRNLSYEWRVPIDQPEQLQSVVETIYPGAVADWAAYRSGLLPIESLETVTARQTGMFRALKDLPMSARSQTVESVCGECVRHPTWHVGQSPEGAIPCAAPCNWWMSHALEIIRPQKMETGEV